MLKDIGADKRKTHLGVMFPETRLHIIGQASNRLNSLLLFGRPLFLIKLQREILFSII